MQLQGELSHEYTNLAADLLKWIKTKLDFLNSEIKFKRLNEIQAYEDALQVIRHEEMKKYLQILHRMRSIDAEFEVNSFSTRFISFKFHRFRLYNFLNLFNLILNRSI